MPLQSLSLTRGRAWTGPACGPYVEVEQGCNDDDDFWHCTGERTDSYLELELEAITRAASDHRRCVVQDSLSAFERRLITASAGLRLELVRSSVGVTSPFAVGSLFFRTARGMWARRQAHETAIHRGDASRRRLGSGR